MTEPKTSRRIARDYWITIGWAVAALVSGTAMNNWDTPSPGHYFIALCFVIHAHGRRNRDTLLALHPEKDGQR